MVEREGGKVYVELLPMGRFVKVSAIDARTGTEVSIVGDPARGQKALETAALQKLRYVMDKQKRRPGGIMA